MTDTNSPTHTELFYKLNLETGQIGWSELQRHFARGVLIVVAAELDLVQVATEIAQDHTATISNWLQAGQLRRAADHDAQRWQAEDPVLWSCVVAPWVLVQEHEKPRNSGAS